MSNPLFTVGRLTGPGRLEILGYVYSSDPSDFSTDDKEQICRHLDIRLQGNILFQITALSASDLIIGRGPNYTSEKGRKFWIYKPGEKRPQ